MTQEHIMKVTIDILKVVMRYDEWTLPFSGYSKFPDNDQVDVRVGWAPRVCFIKYFELFYLIFRFFSSFDKLEKYFTFTRRT